MASADELLTAPAPIAPDELRRALGQFPTGVTIVTAAHGGRLVGMTANSFSSVSLDPPLVLWSAAKAAPSHATFTSADAFAVHVLGADHRDLAMRFAGRGDRFEGLDHAEGWTGAPLIEGLAPIFECRVWARYDGGDHTILVGRVVRLITRVQEPLLFHSGVLRRIEGAGRERPVPALSSHSFARNDLATLLARASQLVSDGFHASLKSWRLSVPQWRVLACLTDAEGLGAGELAAMASMRQPRLTRLLDRMEEAALVERRPDPVDRRNVLIHLTVEGRARVAPVLLAAKEHEARMLSPFSDEERALIKHALDLLIDRQGGAARAP